MEIHTCNRPECTMCKREEFNQTSSERVLEILAEGISEMTKILREAREKVRKEHPRLFDSKNNGYEGFDVY